MKHSKITLNISIFLIILLLIQTILIFNRNNCANAFSKEFKKREEHIMNSVEFKGNFVEGETIKVVVKDANGKDITDYCLAFDWYHVDTPINNNLSGTENGVGSAGEEPPQYTLDKEDIGEYIAVAVLGDYNSRDAAGNILEELEERMFCSNVKVEPKNYASTKWRKENIGDNCYTWYYLNEDGTRATGWRYINGYWYYFNPKINGEMVTRFQYIDGAWYNFKPTKSGERGAGKMLTGWVKDNARIIRKSRKGDGYYSVSDSKNGQKYYYFYDNGKLAVNTTIDGHPVDETGAVTDGYVPENYTER